MKKLFSTIFLLFSISIFLLAQKNNLSCGYANDLFFKKNPNLYFLQEKINKEITQQTLENQGARSAVVVTVPIVFHVIHNNGIENVSDANIAKTLAYLNDAFANANAFKQADGSDTQIQFCLAQRTPDAKQTTGITRDVSNLTDMILETEDTPLKNINRWKPIDYINVWIVKSITSASSGPGVIGYAYLASAHGQPVDGIVIEASTIGKQTSTSVLIHEMGHYFNLYHTFENGCPNDNCLTSGDRACDTPPDQATHTSCPFNSCATDADDKSSNNPLKSDVDDFTQNYMDYSPFSCYRTFSNGQSERMNFTINGIRKSLLVSKGCEKACLSNINVDFSASQTNVFDGTNVVFTNNSNGATTYKWLINNVLVSSNATFNNTFTKPGVYKITLIGGNNDPNCDAQKSIDITVTCNVKASFSLSATSAEINQNITTANTSTSTNAYEWLIDGVLFSTQKDITFSFPSVGTHNILLIAKNTNCGDTIFKKVFVICNHNTKLSSVKTKYTIADNFSIVANSVVGNLTYAWSQNGVSIANTSKQLDTKITTAGLYTFCVTTTDNSCVSTACIDIFISENELCEINYLKSYENQQSESARVIINSPKGGFIVGGVRNNASLILQTDQNLNIIAQKALDLTSSNDEIYDMFIDADNYLLAVGSYAPGSSLEADFILKYDYVNDKIIWIRKLDENGEQNITYNIIQNPKNKNYFITGQNLQGSNIDAFVAEIDYKTGNTLWQKMFDNPDLSNDAETFYKAILYNDALYCGGRNTYNQPNLFEGMRYALTKLDLQGKALFTKYYIKSEQEKSRLYLLDLVREGSFFYAAGMGDLNGTDLTVTCSMQVLKIDDKGDLVWAKDYSMPDARSLRLYKILKVSDGIVLIAYGRLNFTSEIFVIKTDNDGKVVWKKALNYGGDEEAYGAIISGNDIIFTGKTNKNNDDIIIGKIGLDGTLSGTCTSIYTIDVVEKTLPKLTFTKKMNDYNQQLSNNIGDAKILQNTTYSNSSICSATAVDLEITETKAFCDKDTLISIKICNKGTALFKEKIPISMYAKNPTKQNTPVLKTIFLDLNIKQNECQTFDIKGLLLKNKYVYFTINDEGKTKTPFDLTKDKLNNLTSECIFKNNLDSFIINSSGKKLDLGADKFICNGSITKLSAGKNYTSYKWQDGSTDSTFTAYLPGKYSVTVTDACGFEQKDDILITLNTLEVDLGKGFRICEKTEVKLEATAGFDSYKWSATNGTLKCPTCKDLEIVLNKTTTFYITAKKGECISTDSILIEVTPWVKADLGKDFSVCPNDKVTIKPSYKFDTNTWTESGKTICKDCDSLILNINKPTTIKIYGTYGGSCFSEDSINITLESPNINLGKDLEICTGDSILLNIKNYNNVSWTTDNQSFSCKNCTNVVLKPLVKTTYFVSAEKGNCSVKDTLVLSPINVFLELGSDKNICSGDTIELVTKNVFDTYIWKKDNEKINCPNCKTLQIVGDGIFHIYSLQISKGNCTREDAVNIGLENDNICIGCRSGKIFFANIFSPNEDGINDIFYPQSNDCQSIVLNFSIYDRWGNHIFEQKDFQLNDPLFGWKGDYKGKKAQEAIYTYFLELKLPNGKIVVKKGDVLLVE